MIYLVTNQSKDSKIAVDLADAGFETTFLTREQYLAHNTSKMGKGDAIVFDSCGVDRMSAYNVCEIHTATDSPTRVWVAALGYPDADMVRKPWNFSSHAELIDWLCTDRMGVSGLTAKTYTGKSTFYPVSLFRARKELTV